MKNKNLLEYLLLSVLIAVFASILPIDKEQQLLTSVVITIVVGIILLPKDNKNG